MSFLIPCQCCGKEFPTSWSWYVCDKCGFRICGECLFKHGEHYPSGSLMCCKCSDGRFCCAARQHF